MILQRLYELGLRLNLRDDPSTAPWTISCFIVYDQNGEFIQIEDLRKQERTITSSRNTRPKIIYGKGPQIPRPVSAIAWDNNNSCWKTTTTNANSAPAVFCADNLSRILPILRLIKQVDHVKTEKNRTTFWKFVKVAAESTGDAALIAALKFHDALRNPDLIEKIESEIKYFGLKATDYAMLRFYTDKEYPVLQRPEVLKFWQDFYSAQQISGGRSNTLKGIAQRVCQLTRKVGEIRSTVSSRVLGLRAIKCRPEAYLVSVLKSAESYGLDGAASTMVSAEGLDVVVRAMNGLIADKLDQKPTHYKLGNTMLLFWTKTGNNSGFESAFEPTPDSVEALLSSPISGGPHGLYVDADDFYLLAISGNSARLVVRGYVETSLIYFHANIRRWFEELAIEPCFPLDSATRLLPLSLRALAESTALAKKQVPPEMILTLTRAAVRGDPPPLSLLAACLARLRIGRRSKEKLWQSRFKLMSRVALIKLVLLRRRILVTEILDPQERNPAYVCGRLLALFETIQSAAIRGVKATVVDKYFGVFSCSPAMVVGRLYANAQHHLRRLRNDNPKAFYRLNQRLTEITELLAELPCGQLSLIDQGRFALGYYHQRAVHHRESAERKALKAAQQVPPIDSTN